MTESHRATQILSSWFSPAYPVGAYSYSHGLEWAVEQGRVTDRASLEGWVGDLVDFGAGRSDAILLAQTFRADDPAAVAELAEALTASSERHHETMAQGAAFARVTAAVHAIDLPAMPYPVAVGCAARRLALPLDLVLTLFVQAFAANIVSAGVRLIPLGQTDGQRITAALMPRIAAIATIAETASLDDLGGVSLMADIASMHHETQYTRLYRT